VLANAAGAARDAGSWSLAGGLWQTHLEVLGFLEARDCNGDHMGELGWDARCGGGGSGFPSYGVMRCDPAGAALVCRAPAAPAAIVGEHRVPGIQGVVAGAGFVGAVKERELLWNRMLPDGSLEFQRTIRLNRPAADSALAGDHLLVADRKGLTIYSTVDGSEAARLPTCGKARRVFVDGARAYVLGLRSILVVDVTDPAAPAVLADLRISALPSGIAWTTPSDRCSAFYTLTDLLCDVSGVCPLFGRPAADELGHRLFVNLFGFTHVFDFRSGLVPTPSVPVRTGPVTALRAEAARFYVNRGCDERSIYVEEDGLWLYAGRHDVPDWVDGTAATGGFVLQQGPARLYVGTRQ
jgi:hypothetical protein